MEGGVNDAGNLEAGIDWHVNRWAAELNARHTDYGDVSVVPARGVDSLDYSAGLQWRAALHYRAFRHHGPVANYTHVSDRDETVFVGWRATFGNSP